MDNKLLNEVSFNYLLKYPFTKTSLHRVNQNAFLKYAAPKCVGQVIEIGAENQYNHQNFFKVEQRYMATNVSESAEHFLDVTSMSLADNSVDNYLCVSVLEHVKEIDKAIAEISRTLKPGGKLLLVIPFAYPVHDKKDYWRLAPDAYIELFDRFDIKDFFHLGGILSTCAVALQRPKGIITLRFFFHKMLGWGCLLLSKFFEQFDDFPTAYAVILEKK